MEPGNVLKFNQRNVESNQIEINQNCTIKQNGYIQQDKAAGKQYGKSPLNLLICCFCHCIFWALANVRAKLWLVSCTLLSCQSQFNRNVHVSSLMCWWSFTKQKQHLHLQAAFSCWTQPMFANKFKIKLIVHVNFLIEHYCEKILIKTFFSVWC